MINAAIDRGVLPILHFGSPWDSELETLRTLPARKRLLMLDGSTNIRLAREVLGDHMAIQGDVPATLLAMGSESEVYDYVVKLIDDVGSSTGLVVSSRCSRSCSRSPCSSPAWSSLRLWCSGAAPGGNGLRVASSVTAATLGSSLFKRLLASQFTDNVIQYESICNTTRESAYGKR